MKKFIGTLCGLLLCTTVSAQVDTVTIDRVKGFEPKVARAPFMSDSINITGKRYDINTQLMQLPQTRLDNASLKVIAADGEGFFRSDSTLSGNLQTVETAFLALRSPRFEKAKLIIESDTAFRLFYDGKLIGQSDTSGTYTYPISVEPSLSHKVAVRRLSRPGGASEWRLRLLPDRKESEIVLSLDEKETLSMQYMFTGKSIANTTVSPSGRYSTLVISEKVNDKSVNSVLLYDGTRIVAHLDGTYLKASWMPRTDKLWFTEKSDNGLRLMTLDPATLQSEVLYPSLPEERYFVFTPTEDHLIFFVSDKGPENKGIVERVMGRYDTTAAYRDRQTLALFSLADGSYQPLTYGYRDTDLHDISADGRQIIFSASRPTTEIPFSESDFMVMDLQTLAVDTLFSGEKEISTISYTSDDRYLLVSGNANAFGGIGKNLPEGAIVNTYDGQLFLYDLKTGQAKALTKDFDPSVGRVYVLPDRFEALFTAENKDRVSLYRCNLKSGRITQLPTTEDMVRRFATDNKGNTITYSGQSANNSDRYYRITDNKEQLVYDLSAQKMQDLELGTVTDWSFTMPNGDKVPGRFYLPPHFDPAKQYPMIVYYYGGTSPTGRFFEGSYSLPMYAAQDYVVLTLNPSGTTGWGQEYASRHINAWGQRTADEIIASVQGFCDEHPYVNADKIGCIGASYGGFMTQYLQTVTDIFAAAVSHAGISSIASYWGEGTWGIGYSTVASYDSYPWNNPSLYTEQSPLYNADKINTPLLLLHGTADVNVPVGESVQMYNALKILGKEVEFVKVYGEDHGIYEPNKRRLWMQTTMAWFQKWLKDDPAWWDTMYPPVNL
ncbi:MAG: prolyl oligopeptidase family serine peptidase [Porphyromonas sp.]|nr:prolyl oligopeptidase family serine peptidase [Porphyromonas sp.]